MNMKITDWLFSHSELNIDLEEIKSIADSQKLSDIELSNLLSLLLQYQDLNIVIKDSIKKFNLSTIKFLITNLITIATIICFFTIPTFGIIQNYFWFILLINLFYSIVLIIKLISNYFMYKIFAKEKEVKINSILDFMEVQKIESPLEEFNNELKEGEHVEIYYELKNYSIN